MDTRTGDSGAFEARLREVLDTADPAAPLADTLQAVARVAGELANCRYAAINVVGPAGSTECFVITGLPDDVRDGIGRDPSYLGLLEVVATGGETVRITDVSADPRRLGAVASQHPALRGLLGVPIVLRGRPGGGLYLSDPNGRDAFSVEDESSAVLIAGAIATIIERARTAATNRRRDRWTSGASALARELVSGAHHRPLRLIAHRVLDIAEADLVVVLRPHADDSDRFVVAASAGRDADAWKHAVLGRDTLGLGDTDLTAVVHVEHLSQRLDDVDADVERRLRATPVDSALLVPLTRAAGGRGVLGIGRRPGRAAFSPAEVGMATLFAGQVALALDLAESLVHRDQLALIEERDRIARDLHDHVIQRLFAVGLTMQYIGTDPDAEAAVSMERVRASVEEIDDTIKQIRNTIYRLRGPIISPDASLRRQTTRLLDDLESVLGFRPDLTIDGPIDFGVDDDLIDDCVAVLREALTNVARHADAGRAEVSIVVTPSDIALQVTDDGRGLGQSTRRSGLANLRTRAEQRGGTLSIDPGPTGGTCVRWSAPMGAGGADAGDVG